MPVAACNITAVEIRAKDGQYHPYDFEKLVRQAMGELGFFYPSPDALEALSSIVTPRHPLGDAKPLVICAGPMAAPSVAFRSTGIHLCYDIESGRNLTDHSDFELSLSAWVGKYRAELLLAWEQAKESYFSFYPEQCR